MRPVVTFVALTACLFAFAVAGVLAAPTDDGRDAVAVDADVPDPDAFEAPDDPGVATVDGRDYERLGAAIEAAGPGDTIHLDGRFDERVVVDTANVTIAADGPETAVVDGGGEGDVLAIEAPNVTVEGVWVRNSGWESDGEDAGVFVDGSDATLRSVRLTEVTFGVWVDGADRVTVANATVVGREEVASHVERGNGIHLWNTTDTVVRDSDITRVRDGIYFSWAESVEARDNRMWDLRYGVHYMYSDDNLLADNLAFDNDVGYALMVSSDLAIANNTAIDNRGQSGYGILIKDIEDTTVRGNVLADNAKGLYVSNSVENRIESNLVLENDVGVHATAGSSDQTVVRNSIINNDVQAFTTRREVIAWNDSGAGNYWSDARTIDRTNDGTSEIRHRPAGTVERLVHEQPQAAVFTESPAFAVVRLAESSFPVIESPGIVDHHPLTDPPHENWRRYYADGRDQ